MTTTESNFGKNVELRESIKRALSALADGGLRGKGKEFFNALGYESARTLKLDGSPQSFINNVRTNSQKEETKTEQFFLESVKEVHVIFQMVDSDITSSAQADILDSGGFDKGRLNSFLYIAVRLNVGDYARGKYAQMTREINKRLGAAGVVLFLNGRKATLAFVGRRAHKLQNDRDVLEKVSLIRNIDCDKPHRAHLDILAELSLGDRLEWISQNNEKKNFDGLLAAWLEKLDTEELNKRFYKDLYAWFEWAVKGTKFPSKRGEVPIQKEDHVIRLITRILFIWFIKEKDLVANELFVEDEINSLVKGYKRTSDNYYRAILQNLFFATLNTEIGKRKFSGASQRTHRNFYLFRYKDLLTNPKGLLRMMKKTPFINGGLFDCLDSEKSTRHKGYRVDCFTDNKRHRKQISVPNCLFFDEEKGLFSLLNKYKFTVEENTPIEQDVALDPELLGKVFENLLATRIPETGDTARKHTGSYYTPRVIVDYMVDEALVASLMEKVKPADGDADSWRDRLLELLNYAVPEHQIVEKTDVKPLVGAISEMKILDPAVGSGAFPMGILHKLTLALRRLDPDNELWKELQREHAKKETGSAYDEQSDHDKRGESLKEINETFKRYTTDFGRKLYLIQNSIFGVDIQPIACQITKLRFFISLVIEQQPDEKKDNYGIKPLPNLETRFVAVNTLIGLGVAGRDFLQSPEMKELEKKLRENRERHFNASNRSEKLACISADKKLRGELTESLKEYYQRDAVWGEALRIVKDENAELKNDRRSYRTKLQVTTQDTLWEDANLSGITAMSPKIWEQEISELDEKIVKNEKLMGAVISRDESAKSGEIWKKAEKVTIHKNEQINADSEKMAQWNPYDQTTYASWFDAEWMFGVRDGFDVIIGNPPYVQVKKGVHSKIQFPYSEGKDRGKQNLYKLFTEQSYNLCNERGVACMIVQSSLMSDLSASYTRKCLLENTFLQRIVEFPKAAPSKEKQVFTSVTQGTCVYLFTKMLTNDYKIDISINNDNHSINNPKFTGIRKGEIQSFYPTANYFPKLMAGSLPILRSIINNTSVKPLSSFVKSIQQGDLNLTSDSSQFSKNNPPTQKLLRGRHVARYQIKYDLVDEYISAGFKVGKIKLNKENRFLISQQVTGTNDVRRLHFALHDNKKELMLCGNSVNKTMLIHQEASKYFLALLNSKFMDWYFRITSSNNHAQIYELERLPICEISKTAQKPFVAIVDKIIAAKARNSDADTSEQEAQLDKLVYQLYGLTPKQINVIEKSYR